MSSYLIAFVVSDFPHKTSSNGTFTHRIFTPPRDIENAQRGLEDGVKILKAFENYLNVGFSFPKMDQVDVPQFAAGGE